MIQPLCGFCGMTMDECASLEECNYNEVACGLCSSTCRCDDVYDAQRDAEVDDYYDSKK
jgi:hypothetical protein